MNPRKKLRIAILTQDIDNRSCELLKTQLEAKGAIVDFIQYDNVQASDASQSFHLTRAHGKSYFERDGEILDLKRYDGVMLRSWGTEKQGHAALKVFADAGITMANDYKEILDADSKARTFNRFHAANVPVPETIVVHPGDNSEQVLAGFASYPLVIKQDISSRGDAVYFLHDREEALARIDAMRKAGEEEIVLQQFIRCGERQQTYRCVVVNDEVVGVMRLTAADGEMHTNTAKGGSTEFIEHPDAALTTLAINAAKAMRLPITGVDIIVGENGQMLVLEANDGPKISTLVDTHHVPLDDMVADAFVNKIRHKMAQHMLQRI